MKSSLRLELLGPFRAVVDGLEVPIRARKGQSLLALLALRGGREVRRAWLAEVLWPDGEGADPTASLRQCLLATRRALGPAAEYLETPTPRTLRLCCEGVGTDVMEFDAAARSEDPESLQRAVTLYRGPLMEGCFEAWVLPEREARLQAYLTALSRLASLAAAGGEHRRAADHLRLAAAADPLREATHRDLMEALARTGEPQAAQDVYHALRQRLRAELNGTPAPETTALFRSIVRGQSGVVSGQWSVVSGGALTGAGAQPSRVGAPVDARRKTQDALAPTLPHAIRNTQYAATPLIGREEDLREVQARLLTSRLVTLTGPGGVGKTRLAVEVAERVSGEFEEGAAFVDLSGVGEGSLVPQVVGAAVGLPETEAGRHPLERLCAALSSRDLLLVLDNCEHLLDACATLAVRLLGACPHLRIVATSRERLGVMAEAVWVVHPLGSPTAAELTPQQLEGHPSTQLFLQRARAIAPGFSVTPAEAACVASICRHLDGLALAIELAASLVDGLPLEQIETALADRFALLDRGDRSAPARHRTLWAAVDWSYELLDPAEQALFRRLAVFSGGWSPNALPAAQPMGPGAPGATRLPAILSRLVAKSLVTLQREEGEPRYRLLETIREYARSRLGDAGEEAEVRTRHLEHFRGLAETAERALTGPDQPQWLARLDAEQGNFRAALDPPSGAAAAESALCLAGALGRYWQIRGHFSEGRQRLEQALLRAPEAPPSARAKALGWSAFLAALQGDYEAALQQAEAGRELAAAVGDRFREAASLGTLALARKNRGEREQARVLFEESLRRSRDAGDRSGEASTLGYLGILSVDAGDLEGARGYFEESLHRRRELQDAWGIAACLNNLGMLALRQGDSQRAAEYLGDAEARRRALGDRRCVAVTVNGLGLAALAAGDLAGARVRFQESLRLAREIGDRRSVAYSLEAFARLAAREGAGSRAAALLRAASQLRREIGAPRSDAEDAALAEVIGAAVRPAGDPSHPDSLSLPELVAELLGDTDRSSVTQPLAER